MRAYGFVYVIGIALGMLVLLTLAAVIVGGAIGLIVPNKPRCETAYITIAASELCSAEKSCTLTIHDIEKYLKARRVHGECLREGAYE